MWNDVWCSLLAMTHLFSFIFSLIKDLLLGNLQKSFRKCNSRYQNFYQLVIFHHSKRFTGEVCLLLATCSTHLFYPQTNIGEAATDCGGQDFGGHWGSTRRWSWVRLLKGVQKIPIFLFRSNWPKDHLWKAFIILGCLLKNWGVFF